MTVPRAALVAAIAFGATLLGSLSGGSTSLLTTPAWLAMGFPLPAAVAADKMAGTFWTVVGARNYLRGRPVDRGLLLSMILLGIIGAVAGANFTSSVNPERLKRVVGGAIVIVVAAIALRPRIGAVPSEPRLSRPVVIAAALPLGFYEGVFGSGNTIMTSMLLTFGRGFDLLTALGHYYAMASAWCAMAAFSYWRAGHLDWTLALPVTAGAVAGGYLGSRLAARFGSAVVRGIFIVAGLGLGAKLLFGW